jgi:hypothetical protein
MCGLYGLIDHSYASLLVGIYLLTRLSSNYLLVVLLDRLIGRLLGRPFPELDSDQR